MAGLKDRLERRETPLRLSGLRDQEGVQSLGPHVTLDWDFYDEALVSRLQADIEKEPLVKRAWSRNSSHKGLHVILELVQQTYPKMIQWFLREEYLDDPNRQRWDRERGHPEGILFDWKRGKSSGPWERFK